MPAEVQAQPSASLRRRRSENPHAPVSPAGGDDFAIVTRGLTRDYGGTGLFDVDVRIPRGSVYGLVGPNGAGKTTLLSILIGMRRADRGHIDVAVPRSRIAVCPDVPEFDSWLSAYEVVELARSFTADPSAAAVLHALRAAGLSDVADRRVGGFSRGMTQRLGLACTLVGEPELLLLDEPTAALDPAGRAEVLEMVAAMRGRCTVVLSSHILADVQRVADHVGILRGGRLLYQGATQALVDTHLSPRWQVRVAGNADPLAAALAGQPWVTRLERTAPDTVRLDATTLESGERGIPATIVRCDARLVACEPLTADLESAFLALTSKEAS